MGDKPMSKQTGAELAASNAEYADLIELVLNPPSLPVSMGIAGAPLYFHNCRERELDAEIACLKTALRNLLAALPDTRALLLAREDAKAALSQSE